MWLLACQVRDMYSGYNSSCFKKVWGFLISCFLVLFVWFGFVVFVGFVLVLVLVLGGFFLCFFFCGFFFSLFSVPAYALTA